MPSTDHLLGKVLASRYAIEEMLGDGAVGVVYRARHVRVGRPFAVKVLKPRVVKDAKMVRRFEREAELAGRLNHVNVVPVVDTGTTDDGLHYLVMELATGASLNQMLAKAPFAPARTIDLARQLCEGLQHAHDVGLVHRDFKPDNVIVGRDDRGREIARIVDFGVAILREEGDPTDWGRMTTAGIVVGTPHYMAPEQARGDAIDHRIDLFALGVIMYEMVTGKLPFDGDGVDVARANLTDPTPAMTVRAPKVDVDPLLEALVRRLLEKEPSARPQSAGEVRALLDLIERDRVAAAGQLGVALPPVLPPQLDRLETEPPRRMETEPALAAGSQAEIEIETDRLRAFSARKSIAAAVALVGLLAVGWVAMQRKVKGSAPEVAMEAPEEAPVRDRETGSARETAVLGGGSQPSTTTTTTTTASPSKSTTAKSAAAPVTASKDPPTAVQLAKLYTSVGRELKTLDAKKGEDATIDLWPRYRWIRINDEMSAPPERRAVVAEMLAALRHDIRDLATH
jgi:serine/threonine-protein kinase